MCLRVSTIMGLILGCFGVGVEYISESDGVGGGERDVRNGVFGFV